MCLDGGGPWAENMSGPRACKWMIDLIKVMDVSDSTSSVGQSPENVGNRRGKNKS